ncbi:restriction endonuclease [Flavobacterium anhuiense]|uniref:restriction endonuclease n=1 Tax=Flavobacterium anhuiense TaxID=459526 RepID=UPI000E6C0988|nr:restriction endonuclease [Flavobacterium anhuiense]
MADYDLTVFSPDEFEEFSRDLLQEKLGIFIESFKTGKDGGIDLRFGRDKSSKVIVQAKRYKSITSLMNNLKKEVPKVQKLDPSRYMICTTVGLSPHNKETIKELFKAYIKSSEDILGRDDLLNLLSQSRKVEEKYFKLWITSTAILQKVLHSRIYNQSSFELDEIRNQAKIFVQNPSFYKALNILNEHRYIIISGIPGIGKTTLARMLTLSLLSKGYEEFIYLSDNIDDGYAYFKEGSKQIFFFDDFLGKNFFDAISLQNNDDKIVKFINKIKSSPDKVLILATREYILNKAKEVYEAFRINNIEIAKCTIDLSTYSNISKAKILYNHLFHGDIPEAYLNNLLQGDRYKTLINHPNYSPRIIEGFIGQKIWNSCKAEDFYTVLKRLFDVPNSVWLHSFENSLDKFSQYRLLVLAAMGTPVLLSDLELAVKEFFDKNNNKLLTNYDSISFMKSIRELENTFIKTDRDRFGRIAVEYQNPSIYDFLVKYLSDKKSIIEDLIKAFIFTEQFITIFSSEEFRGRIKLDDNLVEVLADRLEFLENQLLNCRLGKSSTREGLEFRKYTAAHYNFLNYLHTNYSSNNKIVEFIYRQFGTRVAFQFSWDRPDYLELLEDLDLARFDFDEEDIIDSFFCYSENFDDLENFVRFEKIFPQAYSDWIASSHFTGIAENIVSEMLENVSGEEVYDYRKRLDEIMKYYPHLETTKYYERLSKLESDFEDYIDHQIEMASEDRDFRSQDDDSRSEDSIISDIFGSLKDR